MHLLEANWQLRVLLAAVEKARLYASLHKKKTKANSKAAKAVGREFLLNKTQLKC